MVDISGINPSNLQPNRVTDRVSGRGNAPARQDSVSTSTGDRIEISTGAREVSTLRRLVQTAQSQSDIRPEAVARAKEKLDNGEYEGVEVSRSAAQRILGY